MSRRQIFLMLATVCVALIPFRSPAPLVFVPGEGWVYESAGGEIGKWRRERAKDQLEVAQKAFDAQDYSLALRAANRVVQTWALSDYAPAAQFIKARCYEEKGNDERAFNQYQVIIEKYPKSDRVKEALARQYQIALRFLNGQRFKLWNYVPFFPSMDKTAGMFEKIVASGPYSDVAPHAQLRVGAAREKQSNYPEAVTAYEVALDRYHDIPVIAADALYRTGVSYQKQAKTAEYDQSTAGKAIATFTDFVTLYPDDRRAPAARRVMIALKTEQARGSYQIAKFYDDRKRWNGALIYYNEVLIQDPASEYAKIARERIDQIKKRVQGN